MQSVSSRIWTRVAVSIYYDDNHYTTGTSMYIETPCLIYSFYNLDYKWWNITITTILPQD